MIFDLSSHLGWVDILEGYLSGRGSEIWLEERRQRVGNYDMVQNYCMLLGW